MPRVKQAKIHHNSKMSQSLADEIVEADLVGKDSKSVVQQTNRRYLKQLVLPDDYPDTVEDWREDVLAFMRLALWKGTRRLADTGMLEMHAYNVPVTTGILVDKIQLLSGQPTSSHVSMHVTASHDEFLSRKQAKQAQVVDTEKVDE